MFTVKSLTLKICSKLTVILLFCFASDAKADGILSPVPPRQPWIVVSQGNATVMGQGFTGQLACDAAAQYYSNVMVGTCSDGSRTEKYGIFEPRSDSGGICGIYGYYCPGSGPPGVPVFVYESYGYLPPWEGCQPNSTPTKRPGAAPDDPGECVCNEGYTPYGGACKAVITEDQTNPPLVCGAGGSPNPGFADPFYPLTGVERISLKTGMYIGWENVVLTYDTTYQLRKIGNWKGVSGADDPKVAESYLGDMWQLSPYRRLSFDYDFSASGVGAMISLAARITRGDFRVVNFNGNGNQIYTPAGQGGSRLIFTGQGRFNHFDADTNTVSSYDDQTRALTEVFRTDGKSFRYEYAPIAGASATSRPRVSRIVDNFGRWTSFSYTGDVLTQLSNWAGETLTLHYDTVARQLIGVTWPDGASKGFRYGDGAPQWALTGVVDEQQRAHSSVGYDSAGRAITSEFAGGANAHSVTWGKPPAVQITERYNDRFGVVQRTRKWSLPEAVTLRLPSGVTSSFGVVERFGMPYLVSSSQAAGSGCAASSRTTEYDTGGGFRSMVDFNGYQKCLANDQSRNLELARIEGLSSGSNCEAALTASTLPPSTRKTSMVWHPLWRLEVKKAEPGMITTNIYNGQADPFSGGMLASCAPSSALIPSAVNSGDVPIAVLCKRVEQATLDPTGAAGFNAPLAGNGATPATRTWQWTYNEFGQVLTETDPLGNVIRSTYYDSTSFTGADPYAVGYTKGDLRTVTNPLLQVTNRQVTRSIDALGRVQQVIGRE